MPTVDANVPVNPMTRVQSDHHCFGCGAKNPIGLHLEFSMHEDGVRAPFSPSTAHQGLGGIVHGGIISTVLDEAMAWATAATGIWAVTGEMRVRYHRPLRVAETTTVTAEVLSERGRRVSVSATLNLDVSGVEIASASATFIRVDKATEAAWQARYLAGTDANGPEHTA